MFINVGQPTDITTTPAIPLLGDVVFVYRAAKAASVKSAEMHPTVLGEYSIPTVLADDLAPTVLAGAEI